MSLDYSTQLTVLTTLKSDVHYILGISDIDSTNENLAASIDIYSILGKELFELKSGTWTLNTEGSLSSNAVLQYIDASALNPTEPWAATMGVQGIKGIQGASGTGVQGTTGLQGIQGLQGVQNTTQGIDGIPGLQGRKGVQGLPGSAAQGITGITGLQGIQGVSKVPVNSIITAFSSAGCTISYSVLQCNSITSTEVISASNGFYQA